MMAGKLVRVDYKVPPSEEMRSMYFADLDFYSDWRYEDSLRFVKPDAVFVCMERGVDPVDDGHHCA